MKRPEGSVPQTGPEGLARLEAFCIAYAEELEKYSLRVFTDKGRRKLMQKAWWVRQLIAPRVLGGYNG